MRVTGAKEKVERAAVELFAARGVDGVSIAEIADAAGISQGALYRHYPSKKELADQLFAAAYRRTGRELSAIVARELGLVARVTAMIAHFCALYDQDAALFRFMLLAQHALLPAMSDDADTPVAAIQRTLADAAAAGEIDVVDVTTAAAVVLGVVLQTALFHVYGRISGPLSARAPALAQAAIAAVKALG